MKLLLISLLVAGTTMWNSKAAACPTEKGKAVKCRVVIVTDDEGEAKVAPFVFRGKGDKPCIVKHEGISTSFGDFPHVITTGDHDKRVVMIKVGDEDGPKHKVRKKIRFHEKGHGEKGHGERRHGERGHGEGGHGEKGHGEKGGWLGVGIGAVPGALAEHLDIDGHGVLITQVVQDSPADHAGCRAHDVLISVDGDVVDGDLGRAIDLVKSRKPGEKVDIVVLRHGRKKIFPVELGFRPGATAKKKHVMEWTERPEASKKRAKKSKEPIWKWKAEKKDRFSEPQLLAKPRQTFEVETNGSIKVRIRKGDSVVVRRFRNEDDLAERSPKLYKKFVRLTSAED